MKKITSAECVIEKKKELLISFLKREFPEYILEGEVSSDFLEEILKDKVFKEEKFGLNWVGKSAARKSARAASTGTLRPSPSDSVNFDATDNLIIQGDNLEVLRLLGRSYYNMVDLIYIDPPYNTGKDFIYSDNYNDSIQNYLIKSGKIEDGSLITTDTQGNGRFHTNWLNMIYPRLKLARELLKEDGVIFISIDDNEYANLRLVMDEIFGGENFVATIVWQKKYSPQNDAKYFSDMHDYIVVYAKSRNDNSENGWKIGRLERSEQQDAAYKNPDNDSRGEWKASDLSVRTYSQKNDYPITLPSGRVVRPPQSRCWVVSESRFKELVDDNRIWFGANGDSVPSQKRFLSELRAGLVPTTWWTYDEAGHNQMGKQELKNLLPDSENVFDTPKPVKLIERIIKIGMGDKKNGIILDFFAGSGTTAHATMKYNAENKTNFSYIMIQLDNSTDDKYNIFNITRARVEKAATLYRSNHSNPHGDTGFRVFKLDSSNLAGWDSDPARADLYGALLNAEDNIKPDRNQTDVLYEVLLKLGLPLTTPTEQRIIADLQVEMVGGGTLVACLVRRIPADKVQELGKGMADWLEIENPAGEAHVLFLDSAFENDTAKLNLNKYLEQRAALLKRNWVVRSL